MNLIKTIFSAIFFLLLLQAPLLSAEENYSNLKKGHALLPVPELDRPDLHESYIDPVFGTHITRITDPSQAPNVSRIRHYYSKANPFNADETLAIMFASNGSKWLYDAVKWQPIRKLRNLGGEPEIQWHPKDPYKFYYLGRIHKKTRARGMFLYDIQSNSRTLLREFSKYKRVRGKLEGNMDKSGRYYALVGSNDDVHEVFVYDVLKNKLSKKDEVPGKVVGDWVSVSPSGKYVVAMGKYRSRIYDIKMNYLRDLPKGTFGHGDLCLGASGEEYLVFDGADYQLDENRNINIVNLKTGKIKKLVKIGWRSTPHVSCRNLDNPGWALISTQGVDRKYPNHDFEVFWVKLDGSNETRRVAHHRSSRKHGGYFAEQQAVTNRDGSKIIFSSNWGGGTVCDYLVDLKQSSAK